MRPKLNRKLKAFTILELLIVMMLSAIVVGMTYLYFTQFRHYLQTTYQQEEDYARLYRFEFALQKDIDLATELFSPSENELEVRFGDEEIRYVFDEGRVVRETGNTADTMELKLTGTSFQVLEEYNGLIESLDLEMETEPGKRLSLVFMKEYPAAVLFRNYRKQD
ncbi:MAG: prepilin-type N-terminal cleavage/methylation domain-containing protein [Bacteroidales bacterium]|jgi:prepilin-type N-terminal cleavage/methylation domain-containing protein